MIVRMKLGKQGFTLLEFLIVMAVVVVLAVMSFPFFGSSVQERTFERSAEEVKAALRLARGKALAHESGLLWGVRFANGASDSYELFSTPSTYDSASTTLLSTSFLASGVNFVSPAEDASTTIYFAPLYGTSTLSTVTLGNSQGKQTTVTVTAEGLVY